MRLARVVLLCIFFPAFGLAQEGDERLLQAAPQGYKLGWMTRKGNMAMTQMLPQAESVENWTEMLTTQVFTGVTMTPEQFQKRLAKGWLSFCKDGQTVPITSGVENGYAFSMWLQACPLNAKTGLPEKTWFKAIKGNDGFYVVQKAFRFEPPEGQVVEWMRYFRSVVVCDGRLADRRCPLLEASKE